MQSPKARPCRILFAGEEPQGSSPTLTWAKAVAREGAEYRFSADLSKIDIQSWISAVRWADAIVFQDYEGPPDYVIRQLALAIAVGRPVIRKWSGTDVMRCVQNSDFRRQAQALDKIISLNLTSEARYTEEELQSVGISPKRILPILATPPSFRVDEHKPLALLAYLPSTRPEFYGSQQVRYAAEKHPDITFIVVADTNHSLSDLPNVESIGWVEDMEAIWRRVGGVMRLTVHDGLPRMVMEALARGKHVLFSHPVEGSWHVTDSATLDAALQAFKSAKTINQSGLAVAKRMLRPDNDRELLEHLTDAGIKPGPIGRAKALYVAVSSTLRLKLSKAASHDKRHHY